MIEKVKQIGLIAFSICISFFLSAFISQEIFIGNSPTVRPHLDSYLAMKVRILVNPATTFIARLRGGNSNNESNSTIEARKSILENTPFSQVATGVAARERDGVAEVKYELNNIKWIEYSYTTSAGTVVKIQIPEGQSPPLPGAL